MGAHMGCIRKLRLRITAHYNKGVRKLVLQPHNENKDWIGCQKIRLYPAHPDPVNSKVLSTEFQDPEDHVGTTAVTHV